MFVCQIHRNDIFKRFSSGHYDILKFIDFNIIQKNHKFYINPIIYLYLQHLENTKKFLKPEIKDKRLFPVSVDQIEEHPLLINNLTKKQRFLLLAIHSSSFKKNNIILRNDYIYYNFPFSNILLHLGNSYMKNENK